VTVINPAGATQPGGLYINLQLEENMRFCVIRIALAALVAAALLAPGAALATKDTLTVAVDSKFAAVEKYVITHQQIVRLWSCLGGNVLYRDGKTKKLDPERSQLTSWKTLNDTTWQFTLRKGLKFHTGNPVKAADFKFTIEKGILDKSRKAKHRTRYKWIKEVKVVDDHTFQIITHKPFPIALDRLAAFSVYDSKYIQEKGWDHFMQHPVGAGPYMFDDWKMGQYLKLSAFPDYWRKGYPKIKTLIFKVVPEFGTRVAELRAGSVDLLYNVDPDKLDQITSDPKLKVVGGPIPRLIFYQFDGSGRASKTPLMNKKVRLAVWHALDRQKIVKRLLRGQGQVVNTLSMPFLFGYNPDQKGYAYDPQKAKALLKEAGFEKGFEIDIWQYYGEQNLFNTAAIGQLGKIGIKVNIKDFRGNIGQLVKKRNSGQVTGIGNYSWGTGGIFDNAQLLNLWFTKKNKKNYNPDPEIEQWLAEADATLDNKVRKELFYKVQKKLIDEVYVMPLFVKYENWGASKSLDLDLTAWGFPRYYEMSWK
jgi:peptide/nickel transport system substrate-binding protein